MEAAVESQFDFCSASFVAVVVECRSGRTKFSGHLYDCRR